LLGVCILIFLGPCGSLSGQDVGGSAGAGFVTGSLCFFMTAFDRKPRR